MLVVLHTPEKVLRVTNFFVMLANVEPIPSEHRVGGFVLRPAQVAEKIPLTGAEVVSLSHRVFLRD